MADIFRYDKIVKYKVTAECTQPLHIGSAAGDAGQVLVHPLDDIPFMQAAGIAGVFREYYARLHTKEEAEKLFGSHLAEEACRESRIRFTDGIFCADTKNLYIELRPRVKIDPKTAACGSSTIQGSNIIAGTKFSMEYIAAGTRMDFSIYLYDADKKKNLEEVLNAVQQQQIQFGGQKSNGCGYLRMIQLLRREFDMKNAQDRKLWMCEEELEDRFYENILDKLPQPSQTSCAYEITAYGSTEGDLLVKSIAVSDYGKGAPDSMNMQNAKKEYIIPGSSFKGVIRSQMQQIADYLGVSDIIERTYGITDSREQKGYNGNIRFYDTCVGNREDNDKNHVSHRIHIDKFTGGVMHGGLFTEKSAFGDVKFKICIIDKNEPDRTAGLLLLALRDLASGLTGVGGGQNVGRGFIRMDKMIIKQKGGAQAEIKFAEHQIHDEAGMIQTCLRAVKGE